jgi:hypothetical protein
MPQKVGQIVRRGTATWLGECIPAATSKPRNEISEPKPSTADCGMLRPISTKCSPNGTAGEGSTRRSKRSIDTWTADLNFARSRGHARKASRITKGRYAVTCAQGLELK